MKLSILIGCFILIGGGCAKIAAMFGGEFPLFVKGTVPVTSHDEDHCDLSMINIKRGSKIFMDKKVSNEFLVSHIVSAAPQRYYFIAKCKDNRIFRSREIKAGGYGSKDGIDPYKNAIDLGVFTEMPPNHDGSTNSN